MGSRCTLWSFTASPLHVLWISLKVGIAAYMYVHTHTYTHSCGVLLATPGGLGGYVLCKELRRREVGVSHTPFTLRLIAPGLCNELGVTDKK